jgi:predicted small secreted protein
MYLKMIKHVLVSAVLAVSLLVSGCVTTSVGPDGQVQVTEPDYEMIQLLSTASVAAWAASQKDGIKPQDAEAVMAVLTAIEAYHADGTVIDPAAWHVAIQNQVPKRYQGLAAVLVQIVASQLEKYGVMAQIPTPDSVGGKIMRSIATGVKLGLSPYLQSSVGEGRVTVRLYSM